MKFKNEKTSSLTYDNNVIYFDEKEREIKCFGLMSNKVVQSKPLS